MAPDGVRRAFVIAHYDAQGRIRLHLRRLIDAFLAMPARVVFVSTGVSYAELAGLPPQVLSITRANEGYDFESYRRGIAALGDLAALDQLVLANSSFVCVEPRKLCAAVAAMQASGADLAGLTASREEAFHLQSYLASFCNRGVINGEAFRRFWAAAEPISERAAVIGTYELGLTRHFAAAGARLAVAFAPDARLRLRALCRWHERHDPDPRAFQDGRVVLDLAAADTLNPMHFLWDEVWARFGIAKLELLQKNPYGINLQALAALRGADATLAGLLDDALAA